MTKKNNFYELLYLLVNSGFSVESVYEFGNLFRPRGVFPLKQSIIQELHMINYQMSLSDLEDFKENFMHGIKFKYINYYLQAKSKLSPDFQVVNEFYFRICCRDEFKDDEFIHFHLKKVDKNWKHLFFTIYVCTGAYEWKKWGYKHAHLECSKPGHILLLHLTRAEQKLRVYDSNNAFFQEHDRENNEKLVSKTVSGIFRLEELMLYEPMLKFKKKLEFETQFPIELEFVLGPFVHITTEKLTPGRRRRLLNLNPHETEKEVVGSCAIFVLYVASFIFERVQNDNIPKMSKSWSEYFFKMGNLSEADLKTTRKTVVSFLENEIRDRENS